MQENVIVTATKTDIKKNPTKPKYNCGKVIHIQTYKIKLARTSKDTCRTTKRKNGKLKSIIMLEIVLLTFI